MASTSRSEDPWYDPTHPEVVRYQEILAKLPQTLAREASIAKAKQPTQTSSKRPKFDLSVYPSKNPPMKCFILDSQHAKLFINEHGLPKRKFHTLTSSNFTVFGGENNRHEKSKITIIGKDRMSVKQAEDNLNYAMRNESKRLRQHINIKQIPINHCTICYSSDHDRTICNNCAYCSCTDHIRKRCPKLNKDSQTVMIITSGSKRKLEEEVGKAARRKRNQLRKRTALGYSSKKWFQMIDEFNEEQLKHLVKIGPSDSNMKETIALDTEGPGMTKEKSKYAGSVCIDGYFGGKLRIQTVYFTFIKQKTLVINPNVVYSGLYHQDMKRAVPIERVRNVILKIIKDRRVLLHGGGGSDLDRVGITAKDIQENNVEVVNTINLFRGVGLNALSEYYWPGKDHLKRNSGHKVIDGHSPERDARITLRLYLEYCKGTRNGETIPSERELRKKDIANVELWP